MLDAIGKLLAVPFRVVAALLRLLLTLLTHTLNLLGRLLKALVRMVPLVVKLFRGLAIGAWKVVRVTLQLSLKLLHVLVAVVLFPFRLLFGRSGS